MSRLRIRTTPVKKHNGIHHPRIMSARDLDRRSRLALLFDIALSCRSAGRAVNRPGATRRRLAERAEPLVALLRSALAIFEVPTASVIIDHLAATFTPVRLMCHPVKVRLVAASFA